MHTFILTEFLVTTALDQTLELDQAYQLGYKTVPASPLCTLRLGTAFTRAGEAECCLSYSEATTEYERWNTVLLAVSLSVIGLVSKLKKHKP